jgi:hypothetical protein
VGTGSVVDHDERTDDQDVDEEFRALLEGLRTTLPGVQLIAAFLLTLPLYERFADLVHAERVAYYVAFGSALASSLLLMAPSSHQRVRAKGGRNVARHSPRHLAVAVQLTVVGSLLFALALTASAFLVSSLVLGTPTAVGVALAVAALCAWSWFYLPLVSFERDR